MRQNMRTMIGRMTFGFLVRHLADRRAHRVFTAQWTLALHREPEFEKLQPQFARHIIRFEVGEVLAPGAIQSFLDGAGAGEQKRGRFEPIVNARHVLLSLCPARGRVPICAANLT